MENKVLVLVDDNDISGLKIGNYLFFRQEKDDILTFYNKKIIPTLLKYQNINLIDYYKEDNTTTIYEKDYNFSPEDIIMISDREKGDIALTDNYYSLFYNQKVYISQVVRNTEHKNFDFASPEEDYKKARATIINEINDEFQKSHSKGEVMVSYFDEDIVRTLMEIYRQEPNSNMFDNLSIAIEKLNSRTKK